MRSTAIDPDVVKRLAWIGLGVIVLLIIVFDNPWPSPDNRPGQVTPAPPSNTQLVLPSTPVATP